MTQQAMCGSVRYRDAETTVACRAASSELHLATSAVEIISNTLSRRYELKPSMSTNSENFLTVLRTTIKMDAMIVGAWKPLSQMY
jgi:hypothetical protein